MEIKLNDKDSVKFAWLLYIKKNVKQVQKTATKYPFKAGTSDSNFNLKTIIYNLMCLSEDTDNIKTNFSFTYLTNLSKLYLLKIWHQLVMGLHYEKDRQCFCSHDVYILCGRGRQEKQ